METTSREARRRRIAERGSERLALITGRIHSLPSSSESHLSDQQSPVIHLSEDKVSSSFSPKHVSSTEPVQLDNYGGGTIVEPYIRKSEPRSEDSTPSSVDIDGKVQSTPVSSTIQNPSVSTSNIKHQSDTQTHHRKIFTPNQISSAVAASEITRICCSVATAIFVFLSYIGFPILGSYNIINIVLFRPLYLLLVTNTSIVLAHLLLVKQRGVVSSGKEANSASLIDAFGLAGQLGKALETGLVLQHVVGALFMDCCVYSIVVISFLSLAQKLGW